MIGMILIGVPTQRQPREDTYEYKVIGENRLSWLVGRVNNDGTVSTYEIKVDKKTMLERRKDYPLHFLTKYQNDARIRKNALIGRLRAFFCKYDWCGDLSDGQLRRIAETVGLEDKDN